MIKKIWHLLPRRIRDQVYIIRLQSKSLAKQFISRSIKTKKLLVVTSLDKRHAKVINSVPERNTTISAPKLFKNTKICSLNEISGTQPDLKIIQFTKVVSIGGSLGVMCENKLYHSELYHQNETHDNKRPYMYKFSVNKNGIRKLTFFYEKKTFSTSDIAIHLLKEHSQNYYHWLFENLPRVIYLIQHAKELFIPENAVILIDEGLAPQILETLKLAIGNRYQLKEVATGERVFCNQLFYVSPFWYAFDNTKFAPNFENDFLVDSYAVSLCRNALLNQDINQRSNRLIYLMRRQNQLRRILNQDDVDNLFLKFRFEFVYADEMNLREQMQLFNSCYLLVGASGAAFSNMIFMQENTNAIIFSPSIQATNYYLFQTIADASNVNLTHFLTTHQNKDIESQNVHDDFYINCMELEKLLLSVLNQEFVV